MKRRLIILLLLAASAGARAQTLVIVNASSPVTQLSREEVIDIFMGRYRKLPDGSAVLPLDLKGEPVERRNFYLRLMDKSLADINAYWARLVFSGRTRPPEGMESQRDMLDRVARDVNAVGYVEGIRLNSQVRIVYRMAEQ